MVPQYPKYPLNPFSQEVPSYARIRPGYPPETLEFLLDLARLASDGAGDTVAGQLAAENVSKTSTINSQRQPVIVDIGAGTGKLTAGLLGHGCQVIAVEPAETMRAQFTRVLPAVPVVIGSAETTGLPNQCANLLTYAQCWHWVDPKAATLEAHRILRPGGSLAIIFHQLDVGQPWVHRLSRIMRSGDVHWPDRPPKTPGCHPPQLHLVEWTQWITPAEIELLGTTRSSYLRANAAGKKRLATNLRWYLYEHLGHRPGERLALPYQTLTWHTSLLG